MECPYLAQCPFFNDKMAQMPAIAGMLKKKYCLTEPATCARYMVRIAVPPRAVPSDLFPMDIERAQSIVSA